MTMRKLKSYCEGCGGWHKPEERHALIRKLAQGATGGEVRGMYGDHIWPRTTAGDRMLWRDLRAVRGKPHDTKEAAAARLAQFIRLALTAGWNTEEAARRAHVDDLRGRNALRAMGLHYENHGRWGNSGWFKHSRRAA